MSSPKELRYWVSMVMRCDTTLDVKQVLEGFIKQKKWSLEEKAIMSSVYTPLVAKWLRDDDTKWPWLEDLAEICWRPS